MRLQNVQVLEPTKSLAEQCVEGKGWVQINVHILPESKRINITNVVIPSEEVVNAIKNGQHEFKPGYWIRGAVGKLIKPANRVRDLTQILIW